MFKCRSRYQSSMEVNVLRALLKKLDPASFDESETNWAAILVYGKCMNCFRIVLKSD